MKVLDLGLHGTKDIGGRYGRGQLKKVLCVLSMILTLVQGVFH